MVLNELQASAREKKLAWDLALKKKKKELCRLKLSRKTRVGKSKHVEIKKGEGRPFSLKC